MNRPLANPAIAPITSARSMASSSAAPALYCHAQLDRARPALDPTDRSMRRDDDVSHRQRDQTIRSSAPLLSRLRTVRYCRFASRGSGGESP